MVYVKKKQGKVALYEISWARKERWSAKWRKMVNGWMLCRREGL